MIKKLSTLSFLFFLLSACATKNPVAGSYSGLYELNLDSKVTCHFIMKREKAALPTVLCHDGNEAWVVPIQDYATNVWVAPPAVTESGTLLAFLSSENIENVAVLMSTDQGRNWDIFPSLKKKKAEDTFEDIVVTKAGRLSAKFKSADSKIYSVEQEASVQSKFTPIKSHAKSYPAQCFAQHTLATEMKIPEECLSGYLKRLLK